MGRIVRAFRRSREWVEGLAEEKRRDEMRRDEGGGEKRELAEFEAE